MLGTVNTLIGLLFPRRADGVTAARAANDGGGPGGARVRRGRSLRVGAARGPSPAIEAEPGELAWAELIGGTAFAFFWFLAGVVRRRPRRSREAADRDRVAQ